MFSHVLRNMSDHERHNFILKTFVLNKNESRKQKRDIDVIKEHHRFLWEEDDAETVTEDSWEVRLARRYYDKLFKEYCIADLSRFKENKVALRWRTEPEVVSGKGQFSCGERKCEQNECLRSWEVNFAYQEQGLRKNALIKLRLCPEHSEQLNYRSKKREIKRMKHKERECKKAMKKRHRKHRNKTTKSSSDSEENTDDVVKVDNEKSVAESNREMDLSVQPEAKDKTNDVSNVEENVWSKKLEVESEANARDNELERYLEDLLL